MEDVGSGLSFDLRADVVAGQLKRATVRLLYLFLMSKFQESERVLT